MTAWARGQIAACKPDERLGCGDAGQEASGRRGGRSGEAAVAGRVFELKLRCGKGSQGTAGAGALHWAGAWRFKELGGGWVAVEEWAGCPGVTDVQ